MAPIRRSSFCVPAFLLLALACIPSFAAGDVPARPLLTAERYFDLERVTDPQISPDGARVIFNRQWINRLEDKWESDLWVMNADGTRARFLVKGAGGRWSPDGTRITYLADGEPGGTQIFVRWMDAEGASSQVTRLTETPANLEWSPDSTRIAFTMLTPRKESWKIDMPAAPKGAKWTEAPRVIESMHYRADRQGFLRDAWTHIYVVPADGGAARQITSGEWNVGARPVGIPGGVTLQWTPDGKELLFDGLRESDADLRYRESHIYAVNAGTLEVRQITRTRGFWADPALSHDGRTIAFSGYEWTPQTYRAEDLYIIKIDGSGMAKISGDLDRDPESRVWAADDSGLFITADDRGSSNVRFVSLKGGMKNVTEGTHMLSLNSVSDSGIAVGTRSSAKVPEDVVRYSLTGAADIRQLTRVNDDLVDGVALGAVEEIWYDSTGGAKIQGWLVKPPDFDAAKKYPLILHIHGGPHAMYNVAFNYSFQNLAAGGYLVLYTNPRGSTGYGTAFGNAIDDAYPSVDYDDLMAGVDAVIAKGSVDTTRMYATGVSGGGVLSSWIVGHTDRFAAAAVRAPVIDWISFAGTTDITAWGYYRFRGRFWENPDKWLAHSPLMHVGKVKTPVLLMTGELDLRTPIGQTEEYYQALKTLGVPTTMIRFNGEYHGTGSKPSNFIRTQLYLMSWFGKHPAPASETKAQAKTDPGRD